MLRFWASTDRDGRAMHLIQDGECEWKISGTGAYITINCAPKGTLLNNPFRWISISPSQVCLSKCLDPPYIFYLLESFVTWKGCPGIPFRYSHTNQHYILVEEKRERN